MKKKIMSITSLVVLTAFMNTYTLGMVYGDDNIKMSSYDTFIMEEKEESTGILKENIEERLNCQGVFDSDIEMFDNKVIEKLNKGEDYEVSVQYFNEEPDGMRLMSENEVDEYFEEVYNEEKQEELHSGQSVELQYKDDSEKTVFQKLGLEEKVFADTETVDSASGKLRTVLIVFQSTTDKRYLYTQACAKWLSEPEYRLEDYLIISVKGKDTVFDQNMPYSADYYYQLYCHGGSTVPQVHSRKDPKDVRFKSNGIYTGVNLCDDTSTYYVKEHAIKLKGYFYVNNNTTDGKINVMLNYAHQQKKFDKNVNVGININAEGQPSITLSISGNASKYYNMISKVASMTFDYKVNPVYK